ncbi:uncharacterized protein [Nerophis lumbriciformis]|uniref:uncharacterized protein n=1 Tax=Nerophis lumbriciformis TaxID=546530 RepID=UPI002AE039C3|nr:uncharacterized protein si:ch211-13c6.2 [Nerophis lumbriciformis]
MDSLETPYEDEASTDFIECAVCDKSARGLTLYKIHLTTPGHLKKEEALVAAGGSIRPNPLPTFNNILQYLDYLNLDEPIIGLHYVEEVFGGPADAPLGPKYSCLLCHVTAHMPDVVSHIIGRKHRQKYMEVKRRDLVTWDTSTVAAQGGKMIRTRAEIIERQDGRGHPVFLQKWEDTEKQISVPLTQRQNGNPNPLQTLFQLDAPQCAPKSQDFDEPPRGRLPPDQSQRACFPPVEARGLNVDRQMYQQDDYKRDMNRQMDLNYRQQDPREEGPHGWAERYPEAPPYRRMPLENSVVNEVVRNQRPSFQEGEPRWSLDSSGNHRGDHDVRPGPSVPEASKRNLPSPPHMEPPRGHVRDYLHGQAAGAQLLPKHAAAGWGGPAQMRGEDSRSMSDIPEPFRRFMTGPRDDDGGEAYGKRRKKSRFSDATAEEVEVAHKILKAGYGPPDPKFRNPSRSVEAETRGPGRHLESQDSRHSDSYQRDGSEKETVFDMLNDIQIENVEEATFLKNKLCGLLKEFKTIKSNKGEPHSSAPQMSTQHQHGRTLMGDPNFRGTGEDRRGPGWKTHETNVHDRQQGYQHHVHQAPGAFVRGPVPSVRGPVPSIRGPVPPARGPIPFVRGPSTSMRGRYNDGRGSHNMYETQHPDQRAQRPERFRENAAVAHRDLRPAYDGFFDSRSPLPRNMEHEVGMNCNPQYSKSLEKLHSTLLELVSRKQ